MVTGSFKQTSIAVLIALLLVLCLFANTPVIIDSRFLGSSVFEAIALSCDSTTQWVMFACCGVYFLTFYWLERRAPFDRFWYLNNPSDWVAAMLLLGGIHYALSYGSASRSAYALTLLAGVALGKGMAACAALKGNRNNVTATVVFVLTTLLAVAAGWHVETGQAIEYRGQRRWTGPWDNPNTFGMLMAVGVTLTAGQILSLFTPHEVRAKMFRVRFQMSGVGKTAVATPQSTGGAWWRRFKLLWYMVAALVCGIGLLKSFSRGAWVGAAVAVMYLVGQFITCQMSRAPWQNKKQLRRNLPLVPTGVVVVSLLVLVFWNFHNTEHTAARRVLSVANVNDFSWRNRVIAWEGALQMIADGALFGLGWNRPEPLYENFYHISKVYEGAAIQTNNYFTLGTTLGIPALACFLVYVGLSLTRRAERERGAASWPPSQHGEGVSSPDTCHSSLATTCRAGAIVLLVGFWFDGGLFKLATGATFWILLKLGNAGVLDDETLKVEGQRCSTVPAIS